ncbi:MAG: FAD-dependent oxidoreductase [Bdellovibrionaceae bacterium]|nr:FAD-dependent oxidoreductase [Pseudobdellovibrionaceae bacterium]
MNSAKAMSLLSLTGCAALDRYFEIEKSEYSKEVLVFGAGISGLCTAYFLKKNGVPYRVFEGSNRVGGRILSQRFPLPIGSIDLGARYIDSMDHDLSELVKDMNLELEEVPMGKDAYFFCMNKEIVTYKSLLTAHSATLKSWNRELARVRKLSDQLSQDPKNDAIIDEIQSYNRVSFADILNDSKLDFKGRFIFKNWTEMHLQKKIADISYLEWLYQLEKLTLASKKMFLPNGLTQFVDILSQRVSGVIPNYNLQLESKLLEIHRSQDSWVCHIQTKEGLKKLSSPFVVLALPFNQLKFIKGIENVFTNKEFRDSLNQAQFKTHYRVVFRSHQKSSKENGMYYFFETNRFHINKEDFVYTLDVDKAVDQTDVTVMKNQMSAVFGVKDFEEVNFYSWTQNPQINGSDLKVNSASLLTIKQAYLETWERMTLQLAGDYLISPENANLNDCVKTASNASRYLTQLILEKDWS